MLLAARLPHPEAPLDAFERGFVLGELHRSQGELKPKPASWVQLIARSLNDTDAQAFCQGYQIAWSRSPRADVLAVEPSLRFLEELPHPIVWQTVENLQQDFDAYLTDPVHLKMLLPAAAQGYRHYRQGRIFSTAQTGINEASEGLLKTELDLIVYRSGYAMGLGLAKLEDDLR